MKIFIFVGALLVAAFFANYFGFVSIPWLDVKSVATYGGNAVRSDEAAQFDLMRLLRKYLKSK
jgi:hypothetical protein